MDRDPFVRGILLLPRRGLHLVEARAHDDVHVFAAEALRAAAAVHRGVAAAQHDDALADLRRVAERHAGEPVDPDVDVRRRFLAAGYVDLAAARRSATDEDRVPAFAEQRLHAVDARAGPEFDAEIEDVADLLVDHRLGQPELGDLRAHHSAGKRVAVEDDALVTERRQVARDGERGGTRADERDPLAVLRRGRLREAVADVFLVIGGDALQPADRHRLGPDPRGVAALFDAAAPARGLARPVTGAAENPGENVGLPVDEVGVAVASCGDQPDVFGNCGVGGARPLTIDDFVEIVGVRDIRWFQDVFSVGNFSRVALVTVRRPRYKHKTRPGGSAAA